jgi:gamma-glutamyltranspeptidase/glutathione hydrolase
LEFALHFDHLRVTRRLACVSAWVLLMLSCIAPLQIAEARSKHYLEYPSIHEPVVGENGMVVSQRALASQVGKDILEEGGNAVDAAVATAFALAVTLPRAGNIGGDGFMLIYLAEAGRTVAIDYRSIAPAAASLEAYLQDGIVSADAKVDVRSAGVPGTVAGLYLAHSKHGKLPWRELVEPAIKLAEDGIVLTRDGAAALDWGKEKLSNSEAAQAAFFHSDGSSYQAGETLRQRDLAWSLRQIAEGGTDFFYRGPISGRLADGMRRLGGFITEEDLAGYRAVERPALLGSYRGYTIATMPPASGGGTCLIELLNILEQFDLSKDGAGSARTLHLMAEAMKLSFSDRWRYLGDTDYVDVPIETLVSKDYARQRAAVIQRNKAMPVEQVAAGDPWAFESTDTTHLSVVDSAGNAVSNTFTLGSDFGSGVMIEGTGFLLGNLIGNFSLEDQAAMQEDGNVRSANLLVPGRRPVSSMTPTIVLQDGELWLITGSPGGSTIIGTVAQIVVNTVDFGMNVAEATHFPRIFQNIDDGKLQIERGFSPDTLALLVAWGHDVLIRSTIGSAQSIRVKQSVLEGGADPRRSGAAVAPL